MTVMRWLILGGLTASALVTNPVAALAAAGLAFDVSAVIEQVKRELAAVQEQGGESLRIEEAQLQLELVEAPGGGGRSGARMMVPGGDFLANKESGKPILRQRLTIDVAPNRETRGGGSPGGLSTALGEARVAVRSAMAATPTFDLKRMTVDLDFIVERDARGQVSLVAHAQDRRPPASNVQGLKVKFATKVK